MASEFSLTLNVSGQRLPVIRAFVVTVASLYFSRDSIHPLEMCVNEMCENIVRHAYNGGSGYLKIRLKIDARKMSVIIIDRGEKFDPREYRHMTNRELVENEIKGKLGIRTIKVMCNRLQYERLKNKNKTVLIRKRSE